MPAARSSLETLIGRAVRCVACDAPMGGCDCWIPCACGWSFEKGGACRNPIHAAEQAAEERARAIATAICLDLAGRYPEPMRHASGGFRKTMREVIRREMKAALLDAQAPEERA